MAGGWGQAIASGLGRVGSEAGSAVDQNLDTALRVIQQRLAAQEIQQQIKASEQRMKQQGQPSPQGIYQTPQGAIGTTFDPQTSKYGSQPIPGLPAAPGSTPPEKSQVDSFVDSLPAAKRASARQLVDIYIQNQDYKGLRDFMSKATLQEKPPARVIREQMKPDKQSNTGWAKVAYDATTGEEISRQLDVAPQRGMFGSETTTTDQSTGATTTSVRKPIIAGTGGASGTASPASGGRQPSKATTVPFDANLDKQAQDWINLGMKPSGGPRAEAMVRRYMTGRGMASPSFPGTGELTPQSQQVLTRTEPILQQSSKLISDIDRLGLDKNNTPGYLALARAKYGVGIKSPEGSLGNDIAGLSLGSIVEATAALNAQGGGSRALPALMKALQHTPNPWVDSPALIREKLQTINARLQDVVNEINAKGTKHYRPQQQNQIPQAGETIDLTQ